MLPLPLANKPKINIMPNWNRLFNRLRADCDRLLPDQSRSDGGQNQRGRPESRSVGSGPPCCWWAVWWRVGIALAFFMARTIVEPVRELTAATARLAQGDLAARAKILSRDEIGALASEFNRMAEQLQQLRRSDLGSTHGSAQQTTEATIDSLYDPVLVTDEQGRHYEAQPGGGKDLRPGIR